MAQKEALRQLQQRLAVRLQEAQSAPEIPVSWLAVEVAGNGFLLPLAQAGEIFKLRGVTPVPHTAAWFTGVASLRGSLYAVVDLARFFGLRAQAQAAASTADQARLITLNPVLQVNAALLVDALAGLRQPSALRRLESSENESRPAFVGARYVDAQDRVWQTLDLSELAVDKHFLSIRSAA